jgi:hypothetical protein
MSIPLNDIAIADPRLRRAQAVSPSGILALMHRFLLYDAPKARVKAVDGGAWPTIDRAADSIHG